MVLEKLGPFKIGRVLGRGGMGAVYEGTHETDDSAVAIKVLPDSLEEDAEVRVRFETEIETLQRLHHPNIVRLTGFGAEQGQLYYVMEYVDGPSLQQELRKKRLFQWHEVAKIGLEICQALRHAHDRGVIHRDIKPANILLDQEGNVKLSDFGIARFFGSQQITDIHSVIGTLEYMSPEQALANPISSNTDLFSLGCVLYSLLTSKPPFPARSLPELLRKHQTTVPLPIRSVRYDVPDELGYIIFDMLQIRPEDRPRNAFLVTKRLQSLLQALMGDPTAIKVLPMSADTPKQYHESAFRPSDRAASPIPPAEDYGSGSVIDLGRISKPETLDRVPTFPQSESLAGSFQRIGEDQPVAIFPASRTSGGSEDSRKIFPLTETVTACPVHSYGGLRHGDVILTNTQTLRPAKDEPLPDATYLPGITPVPPQEGNNSRPSYGGTNNSPPGERSHAAQQNVGTVATEEKVQTKRFTAVANKRIDPFEESDVARPMLSLPVVLSSIMLLLIGLTVYYLIQPVPAEVLYARITATIREEDTTEGYSPARLRLAQNDIRQFLEMYPDHPSAEQIRVYEDELDLLEHERRLERRMQFSTLRSLSPVERTYVNVLTSSPHDPEQMIDKLRAFIAVFQTARPEESAIPQRYASGPVEICVELARRRLKKMEQDVAKINTEQEQVIRRRLDEAAEWEETDPVRAGEIRRGIIELYQHHRWAQDLVEEAKEQLEADIL